MGGSSVSATISYWFKLRETRHSAEIEYEYEQRKKLRELIGRYHGRLLNAANSMNYRFWNLYANQEKGWLDVRGDYEHPENYYFRSCVYRFLNVCALIRQLEEEAVLLDARIAQQADFMFLNYAAAIHWVMTDVALTKGLPYHISEQTDHFFSDQFRQYCDCCLRSGNFVSINEFQKLLHSGSDIGAVFCYFDGLKRDEGRLRWDRLVAFHLLIMAFVNTFGYKRQHSNVEQFVHAARQMRNPEVLKNLVAWLPRHDLDQDPEAQKIKQAFLRTTLG